MDKTDNQLDVTISSLVETDVLGRIIGQKARPGDVILLYGDLGAGKTTLTQAIARGLAVPEENYVTSPSFALMHEYSGRLPLYHIDCYRLNGEDEIIDAGLLDYIENDAGLCIIEWPERLGQLIPADRLSIHLLNKADEQRNVVLTAYGKAWVERMRDICKDMASFQTN